MTAGVTSRRPSLRLERGLQRAGHRLVAGMDEVGRGAIAGPVSVGVVVIDEACRSAPVGVKDSKMLSPQVRERLVPKIQGWSLDYAVGHASPGEIDCHGIMVALRLAGMRALTALSGRSVIPDLVILDGNHDWLSDPHQVGLLGLPEGAPGEAPCLRVRTMVKADMFCSSVAAASVLAKVERDAIMVALAAEVPDYAWELNKGYCAPEHLSALQSHGPSVHHRRSWRLPGLDGAGEAVGAGATRVAAVAEALLDDEGVPTERGGEQ